MSDNREKAAKTAQAAEVIAWRIWDIRAALEREGVEIVLRRHGKEIHPDLVRFKGYWYVGCNDLTRKGVRIIRSADGFAWETVADPDLEGNRRFSITAAGELMVNLVNVRNHQGRSADADDPRATRFSLTMLSADGKRWAGPFDDQGENTYRWDVAWHEGQGYSLAYWGRDAAGTLYATADGRTWRVLAREVFPEAHRAGYEEASLAFEPADGTIHALVRAKNVYALIGTARPPYTRWRWREARAVVGEGEAFELVKEGARKTWRAACRPVPRPAPELLGPQMCGPKLKRLADGRLLAAGVSDATSGYEPRPWSVGRIDLFELDPAEAVLTRLARLDGFGAYPGIVEHDGKIWVSCGRWKGERPEVCLLALKM